MHSDNLYSFKFRQINLFFSLIYLRLSQLGGPGSNGNTTPSDGGDVTNTTVSVSPSP
jgi:hypothetical protein